MRAGHGVNQSDLVWLMLLPASRYKINKAPADVNESRGTLLILANRASLLFDPATIPNCSFNSLANVTLFYPFAELLSTPPTPHSYTKNSLNRIKLIPILISAALIKSVFYDAEIVLCHRHEEIISKDYIIYTINSSCGPSDNFCLTDTKAPTLTVVRYAKVCKDQLDIPVQHILGVKLVSLCGCTRLFFVMYLFSPPSYIFVLIKYSREMGSLFSTHIPDGPFSKCADLGWPQKYVRPTKLPWLKRLVHYLYG